MKYLRTDVRIPKTAQVMIGSILFVLIMGLYGYGERTRHQANPDDKVMPTVRQMFNKMQEMIFPLPVPDDELDWERESRLSLQYPFWNDLWASARRFALALAFVVMVGVPLGLYTGTFPLGRAFFYTFLSWIDKVPALALLPIIFVIWSVLGWKPAGDSMKVALMVIGVLPTVALDAAIRAQQVPRELVCKVQSLGATEQEVAWRGIFPQIWPGVVETIRLNFKSMAILLIAAEFVAADAGLGYRIFVSKRNMEMDIIIPYVLVMMLLFFALDFGVQWIAQRRYRWYYSQ